MQKEDLLKLVDEIKHYKCEFQSVEVKTAARGCPKLYDTLSSFSNQDSGGIIIFGLREIDPDTKESDFETIGVYNLGDLEKKVSAQCKEMEPEVRTLFTTAEVDGKFVASVEVPGVDVSQRPVYYKGAGRQRGSYVRVGEADEPMNDYEIYTYDAFRRRTRDDLRVVEEARMSMLKQDAINDYLDAVKAERKNLSENATDSEILELMGVTSSGKPTLSGVMCFGVYPQAYFPQLGVTCVVVPGVDMGDVGIDGERFIDNKRINGTIPEMLEGVVDFVKRNSRVKTIIEDNGRRNDKMEFPMKAVREVILNALVHRDYSIHTEGTPITVCMFSDRMEVVNKGGLYGRITVDSLGKVRPDTRNPALANILEVMNVTENRYSGIPTIRKEMMAAGLPEPEFISRRGEFQVTLRNNMLNGPQNSGNDKRNGRKTITAADLILFCKQPRTREEIADYAGYSQAYVMSELVLPLTEQGKLKMSMPDKPKSKNQRYYSE